MIAYMMAHFKLWLERASAPFWIERKRTWLVPNADLKDSLALVPPAGEVRVRDVTVITSSYYCCDLELANGLCPCGQPEDIARQDYFGASHDLECDANGVETESHFWRGYLKEGEVRADVERAWENRFRLETAQEAYVRFVQVEMRGDRLAQCCERRHYANLLRPLTAEICAANPDTYKHLSALMKLSPIHSYTDSQMIEFRKCARALVQAIDSHYAYEGPGGQQAEASFYEAAYLKAKLESVAETTTLMGELVQSVGVIAESACAIKKRMRVAEGERTDNERAMLTGMRRVAAEIADLVIATREIPEKLEAIGNDTASHLGYIAGAIDSVQATLEQVAREKPRRKLQ